MSAGAIMKFIANFGVSAAKKKYGTSKATGLGSLTDEQLGKGLNKYQAKKAEEKAVKVAAKNKPKPKAKPKSPPRDVKKSATQKDVRFSDKPEIDDAVESDAARSVDETNMVRGAASAGRSTNAPGKTNIGSASISNFIKDQMSASPGMAARKKQDEAFRRAIANSDTEKEKKALRDALEKVREKRLRVDEAQQKRTGRRISASTKGKPKGKPKSNKDIALAAIMPNPNTGKGGGELVPEFFELNKNLQDQLIRSANASLDAPGKRRLMAILEKKSLKKGNTPQLESAGPRTIDTNDRMIQDAKQSLIAVFGQKKGTQLFNEKLRGAKTKPQFLVDIRSMVSDQAKGQKGTRASETGAIVGERRSKLKLADKSYTTQKGRKELGSRRAASGNAELDAPVLNRGGMVRKRMGSTDYRKGGMVKASYSNKRGK